MYSGDDYEAWKRRYGSALQSVGLRPPLPTSAIDYLVENVQRLPARRGETIFGPDDKHRFSYLLTDGLGSVECTGHSDEPLVIQLVRPGRMFGVEVLPTTRRRAIRAVAQTDAVAGLITQEAMAAAYEMVPLAVRFGIMSYAWRTLSALGVGKAELRRLTTRERLWYTLWTLAPEFGAHTPGGVVLTIRLSIQDLSALVGASTVTVKHALHDLALRGHVVRSGGHLELRGAPPSPAVVPTPCGPYQGMPAPWARGALDTLLARCNHLGLNGSAMQIISRRAALFAVPAGELLLPPGSDQTVAFVVRGSAWLEGTGKWGHPFALQLLPPGRFVRLPTGPSSHGTRLWGRAHQDCIVALLTLEEMVEVIEAMTVRGSLVLLDATCRDLSRHVCDLTTAPTRTLRCRVLQAFVFLAHDFPGRTDEGIVIKVPVTEADVGRLVGVGHPAVARALAWLIAHQWIMRVAPQRYVLLRLPERERSATARCDICNPDN